MNLCESCINYEKIEFVISQNGVESDCSIEKCKDKDLGETFHIWSTGSVVKCGHHTKKGV